MTAWNTAYGDGGRSEGLDADQGPDCKVLWNGPRTATHSYICDNCGEPIPIGSRYNAFGWIFEGKFESKPTCIKCVGSP